MPTGQDAVSSTTMPVTNAAAPSKKAAAVSVSNWSTDEEDVERSVDALRRAIAATA